MNALAREIRTTVVLPGTLRLWWIGQAGFVVKSSQRIIYIDPYLSNYCERITRGQPHEHVLITPAPLQPDDVDHADWILCTHDHADHLDPEGIPIIMGCSPHARLVVPRCALETTLKLGVPSARIHTLVGDDSLSIDDFQVHSVPAMHERFDRDPEKGFPYLGYVLTLEGFNLLHTGDSIPFDGQAERIGKYCVDVMFVPINGRDDCRHRLGLEGNFTAAEAVELATAVEARLTIPMHYDKFTINSGDVEEFRRLAHDHGLPYRVLRAGESIIIPSEMV